MPAQISQLSRSAEGLHFAGEHLNYRITGLTSYNLERLRVTLKAFSAEKPSVFHVDTLDLYNSRARESFAEACAKYLTVEQQHVMAELSILIGELETERVTQREQGSGGPAIPPITEEEKREAEAALKSKDLLNIILSGFESLGYIGEKTNKLIGIMAAVSRLLPDPLALLFLSRPGAGKTGLQNSICKFVPPESAIQYTRLTGQSLFYRESEALKNKVLAIEEEEGMQEAIYSIRTLISNQRLSVAATRTDVKSGKLSSDDYLVKGPVVVFISTTNPDALDDETRQRFMILTIDETNEQTERILQAQRTKNTLSWYKMTSDETTVTGLHHTMQRLLKPLTVLFPDELKVHWPYGRLQMRREQGKFLSLIKASALLYQYQRKTGTLTRIDGKKVQYVLVAQQDIDLALELGKDVFARNVDDVSPTGRTLLTAIVALVNQKYETLRAHDPKTTIQHCQIPITRKELRECVFWSDTQVRRTCEHLVELGYLGRVAGRQGAVCRYAMVDSGEFDPVIEFGAKRTLEDKNGFTGKVPEKLVETSKNEKSTT